MKRSTRDSLILACALAAGIVAAVALYVARARAHAVVNSCLDNLHQIEVARDQWASLHNRPTDVPTWEDLRPYFPNDKPNSTVWKDGLPICPEGGTYTIGKPGQRATCTVRSHNPNP